MIRASDISVRLAGRQVLHGISLDAAPGAMTAIVGPNGSGKTTTLKAISGELTPSAGKVTINGRDIASLKPWELALKRGVLPQSTVISFPFTVREIVRLGLMANGGEASAHGRIADQALEAVDLAGFSGRFYQELSGGEQQRVQLARVLCQISAPVAAGEPRYLLLDEPVIEPRHPPPAHDHAACAPILRRRRRCRRGHARSQPYIDVCRSDRDDESRPHPGTRSTERRADRRDHGSGLRLPNAGERRSGTRYPVRIAAVRHDVKLSSPRQRQDLQKQIPPSCVDLQCRRVLRAAACPIGRKRAGECAFAGRFA
jgi:ABC-type lipoprotein export system ATPase subunit